MLNHNKLAVDHVTWWSEQPTDNENSVNGFDGEFNYSDHKLVPQTIRNFVIENYPRKESFDKVPLETVNELMNSAWRGPGSMARIVMLTTQLREVERRGSPVAPVTEDTTVAEFCKARGYHSDDDIADI